MIFQYQYQYQYQLQRGLGLTTYDSFSQLLYDSYSNPVVFSLLVAIAPLVLFALRRRIIKTGAYHAFHSIYSQRKKDKELKQARQVFEEAFLRRKRYELSSIFLIAFTVLLGSLIFTKSLFFVAVTSNSMAPTFWGSDLVLVQSVSPDYKTGDIIVFQNPRVAYDNKVIHRIFSIDEENLIRTKGDNNNFPDDWALTKKDVLGTAVTLNERPIIAKKAGRYFIKDYEPFKEMDPTYQFLRASMSNVHSYGPLYLIIILCLILLTQLQPERGKVY